MSNFFVALWESVFQPGTSPQLIIATHVSFLLLLCVLGSQIYLTQNIHFIALAVIACLLWITVTWFIHELNQIKLQSNEQLKKETEVTKPVIKITPERTVSEADLSTQGSPAHSGSESQVSEGLSSSTKRRRNKSRRA